MDSEGGASGLDCVTTGSAVVWMAGVGARTCVDVVCACEGDDNCEAITGVLETVTALDSATMWLLADVNTGGSLLTF